MYFKLRAFVILLNFCLVSGCDFLRSPQNDINEVKRINLDVSQLKCLGSVSEIANKYFEDKATHEEVEYAFTCIDASVDKFLNVTRPSIENKYSAKELQFFLNRYLLEQQKISTEFMNEIMKVKTFVLGGDVNYLSRDEIFRGRAFLVKVKEQLKNLLGSIRIITFQSTFKSEEEAKRITNLLHETVQALTIEAVFSGEYSIRNSIQFFKELSLFAQHKNLSQRIQDYASLAEQIKNLFIGVGNNTQSKSQWLRAVEWTVGVYTFALELYWLLKNFDSESVLIWRKAISLTDRLMNLLISSPQFVHHRIWHTVYLDSVIKELMGSGLVRSTLTSDIWIKSYKMAIIRFLNRDLTVDRNPEELAYIDESHLNVLNSEWQVWKSNQTWILGQQRFERSNIQISAKKQIGFPGNLNGQNEWFSKIAEGKFYTLNSYRNMIFSVPRSVTAKMSLSGLSLMNTINSLARFMIRSYAEDSDNRFWNKKLVKSGLSNWERDFFELLTGIRIIDPRVQDRPNRFIQEANLFTLSGNGDDQIDIAELSELITLMWVSGKFITDQFHSVLVAESSPYQCSSKGLDIMGKPRFDRTCVVNSFYSFFPKVLEQVEGLKSEWGKLSVDDKLNVIEKLLDIGKIKGIKTENLIEYVEYRTSIVFLYYLESIFSIYDHDGDGILNYKEVLTSFPRFKAFIEGRIYSRLQGRLPGSLPSVIRDWDTLTLNVFLYTVYNGKEPSIAELLDFQYQKMRGLPPISRIHMLKVFSYLKSTENQN